MAQKKDLTKPFRIIGVQILDTDVSVRKVLTPGWYPLIKCKNDIGIDKKALPIVDDDACPLQYYQQKGMSMPTVSISAIVGKNGTGKTSLVGIIYRILNNFANTLLSHQGYVNSEALSHAWGVEAKLFFELDGIQKFILCYDRGSAYFEVENGIPKEIKINGLTDNQVKDILNGFFYTIGINYSLYAFNPNDYDSLFHNRNDVFYDAEWIEHLFHKNDGYFVPMVLTPFREKGRIFINNENDLAKQRLLTLSLLFHSQKKEFLDGYKPKSLQYTFNEKYIDEKGRELQDLRIQELEVIKFLLMDYLQKAWIKVLGCENIFLIPKSNKHHETASFYLAYKTLKICTLYSEYKDDIPFDKIRRMQEPIPDISENTEKDEEGNIITKFSFGKNMKKDEEGNIITQVSWKQVEAWAESKEGEEVFVNLARKLRKAPTNHVTAKLHQTIEYLKNERYKKNFGSLDVNEILGNKKYENYDDVMMHLPPPIFKSELQFTKKKTKNNDDYITFAKMSSGERQMYYSLSNVFYHIRNIAGIKENGRRVVRYHHINLIFDEAELYYHPEYQRKFVSMLLSGIAFCHINKIAIRSINIVIITHSPFILSDIPDTNILFLGSNDKDGIKTLGANIYNILKGGFFLDYAIGDHIKAKLQTYLEIYHQPLDDRAAKFAKVKDEMKYVIDHLGEEYLRDTFQQMYHEMASNDNNEEYIKSKIEELKRQQEELEEKLKKKC